MNRNVTDRDIDSMRTLGCSDLRLTHDFQQFLWSNRLNKMGVEACRSGAFAGYFVASRGNRNHQQRAPTRLRPELDRKLISVHARHVEIQHANGRVELHCRFQGSTTVVTRSRFKAE